MSNLFVPFPVKLHDSRHLNIQFLLPAYGPLNTPGNIIFYLSVLFAPLPDQDHFVKCVSLTPLFFICQVVSEPTSPITAEIP